MRSRRRRLIEIRDGRLIEMKIKSSRVPGPHFCLYRPIGAIDFFEDQSGPTRKIVDWITLTDAELSSHNWNSNCLPTVIGSEWHFRILSTTLIRPDSLRRLIQLLSPYLDIQHGHCLPLYSVRLYEYVVVAKQTNTGRTNAFEPAIKKIF